MANTTSQNGKNLIKQNEGTCLTVKGDNKGPQIGHGHDLTPAELASGTVNIGGEQVIYRFGITLAQADALLDTDLAATYEPAVNRQAPQANQNQFDALVDFTYNLGVGPLATMLHHGFDQAPAHIPAWCYAEIDGVEQKVPALEARRQAEVELFNTPVAQST